VRIVVVGGGLVGRRVVPALRAAGHVGVLATPGTGVDAYAGTGLSAVLTGADAVVDATNAPFMDEVSATDFFVTTTANLLAAGTRAGIRHHVLASFLGADRVPGLGYCRAKLAQERLVRAAAVPWTIVRSTHTFEFLENLVQVNTGDGYAHLPPLRLRPLAAADLAAALARIATGTGTGTGGIVEVAGPREVTLDDLARRLAGPSFRVITEPAARPFFGAAVGADDLLPGPGALITATGPDAWLTAMTDRGARSPD
jgi:uncharacterized protein YbjT (DUF2867 family)